MTFLKTSQNEHGRTVRPVQQQPTPESHQAAPCARTACLCGGCCVFVGVACALRCCMCCVVRASGVLRACVLCGVHVRFYVCVCGSQCVVRSVWCANVWVRAFVRARWRVLDSRLLSFCCWLVKLRASLCGRGGRVTDNGAIKTTTNPFGNETEKTDRDTDFLSKKSGPFDHCTFHVSTAQTWTQPTLAWACGVSSRLNQ